MAISLEATHEQLGWPSREQVLNPAGSGPGVYAQLAKDKLGKAIKLRPDVSGVDIGVLTVDSNVDATEAPIAVVCEFKKQVSLDTLKETHRLAWNFCRTRLLITIEPHLLRAWTCYERPAEADSLNSLSAEIEDARIDLNGISISQQAAQTLHWVQLVSGQFFREHRDRFRREDRADQTLLSNLIYIRQELYQLGLGYDVIHDLLARIIFIQFLFQRKDSYGRPALHSGVLESLRERRILSRSHTDLPSILGNHKDTYALFHWLDDVFNGDLFPGKEVPATQSEAAWRAEMQQVKPNHLELLAQFVDGTIRMDNGQWCLWPQYSFDAIPLEFISSIYEVFVRQQKELGAYYTPSHIVDFMLDSVLPWDSDEWDVKILDPACGSGIFLVKAFQRLIHRWRNANPNEEPRADLLRRLLERNIFGIDKDPHAVRVASFSLYLAMCDEIDPRYYWQHVRFPVLRGRQLISEDFFAEDHAGFMTHKDAAKYDLVIGNAPWGKGVMSEAEAFQSWAKDNEDWPIANKEIGAFFLKKAADLTQPEGHISMLQSANALLFNRNSTVKRFREKLFSTYKVEEVVNLSALRFGLFKRAVAPSCIITMRPIPPDSEPLTYICPKPAQISEDDAYIVIEPHDISTVSAWEAATDPWVWTALIWGGHRDLAFIRRLGQQDNLAKLKDSYNISTRNGIERGDRGKRQPIILGRHILEKPQFPESTFLQLKAEDLPTNHDPDTHSKESTDFSAFELPQLVLRKAWQQDAKRFSAAIIDADEQGILCSQRYVSVHAPREHQSVLEAACLSYNSQLAVYFLLLTSSRFGPYRPDPLVHELLSVPIPTARSGLLQGIRTVEDVDKRTYESFSFKDAELVLIDDLFKYTLPDFKGTQLSPGRQQTHRKIQGESSEIEEPELTTYCEYFLRVLKAGFGRDKDVCATIFQEKIGSQLPIRLVAIHLDWPGRQRFQIQPIDFPSLWRRLQILNSKFLKRHPTEEGGVFYRRVARVYDTLRHSQLAVPTIYLIKPDQVRYWTRSIALRDADEVAADIMLWGGRPKRTLAISTEVGRD